MPNVIYLNELRMKKFFCFSICVLMTVISLAHQYRALLVGVANYPDDSGWRKINSDNDISLLTDLLKDNYIIESLVDEKATCSNIKKELSRLEDSTEVGDTIIISFSCHGQQMIAKGTEEQDSLDEALVPYDAKLMESEFYHGENHLRDNELSVALSKIRKKAGATGFVLILLDACHSGDSFRGVNDKSTEKFYRGSAKIFGSEDSKKRVLKKEKKNVKLDKSKCEANIVYISACQSYQINEEKRTDSGIWYGSLCYAFSEAYRSNKLQNIVQLCVDIKESVMNNNKWSRQCPEFASSITLDIERNDIDQVSESIGQEDNDKENLIACCVIFFVFFIMMAMLLWKKK